MSEPVPSPADPGTADCEFCRRPLGREFFRVAGRVCCSNCAEQAHELMRLNDAQASHIAGGAMFGLLAALLAAAVWAAIGRATGSQWGILAWAIGLFVSKAVLTGSQQRRGVPIQAIAMLASVIAVALGKLTFLYLSFRIAAQERGEAGTLWQFLSVLRHIFRTEPAALFEPLDLLWYGLALWIAWRACKPVSIPLAGPFPTYGAVTPRDAPAAPPPVVQPAAAPEPKSETWQSALLKTGGSMLLSILIYQWYAGWGFAIGLVLLVLVHEMGHVAANLYYGIRSSPPIFIPFLGAVISLRQRFPNARVEAISAIAGPLAGTIGAVAPLAWYFATQDQLALVLAAFGFMINLFNMLPLPPLDGGRVMAAVSPWVWLLGLLGLGALVVNDFRKGQDISILMILLVLALPRVVMTLRGRARSGTYYQIGHSTRLAVGAIYLGLLVFLVAMSWYLKQRGAPTFI